MDRNNYNIKQLFLLLLVFAFAMGVLEAVVVVYLRELYYPGGFAFPLKVMHGRLVTAELARELSTLVMILSVSWLTGKTLLKRLNSFLFVFGVWDIVYYLALKLFLDWPESLLTPDLLFLIPVVWVGPVIAPVICSIFMIFMALSFEWLSFKGRLVTIKLIELTLFFAGAFLIYISFTYDFTMIIMKGNFFRDILNLTENRDFINIMTGYVPDKFYWGLFTAGILAIAGGCMMVYRRAGKSILN